MCQASTGGGIVGAIRSLLPFGGSSAQTTSQPTTETNVSNLPKADPEVTHESTLSGGTTAQVSTAPGHTAGETQDYLISMVLSDLDSIASLLLLIS